MRRTTILFLTVFSITCIQASDLDSRVAISFGWSVELNERARTKVEDHDQKLDVLNVNLGLLTGLVAYVPEYPLRKKYFAETLRDFIFGNHVDVVFIQEIWYQDDFRKLNAVAREEGLVPVFGDKEWEDRVKKYGMQILVREKSLKEGTGVSDVALENFSIRTKLEALGLVERGLLSASVTLANGRKVRLANAHLSATVGANEIRRTQVREATTFLKRRGASDELVLFGADFNVSPEFEEALPKEVAQWQENRAPYVEFHESLYLIDAFKALHPKDKGYTWDKRLNTLISSGPAVIKDEPLQRTDFIWVGIPAEAPEKVEPVVRVEESRLVFTQPTIEQEEKRVHLTDHFGVFSKLRVK